MKFKKGNIPWNKGLKGIQKCSKETKEKMSKAHRGRFANELNPNWKFDSAKRRTIHQWVTRKKGKPDICEHCGKKARDWTNKDHSYKRNLDDYISLCVSCHRIYDIKNNDRPLPPSTTGKHWKWSKNI